MEPNTIIAVGVCIIVLGIIYFIIDMNNNKGQENELINNVKAKQLVKRQYNSQSSPKYSVVPKKLFQTWHSKDLPPKMRENIEIIQRNNPELEYFLFDNNECVNFIKAHFSDEVVDAYNTLLPGAYKADLWRYCVMYIHGGVYLDVKYQCMDGFKFIDIMDREHFVLERPYYWKPGKYGIYNALIIAKPGNILLLDAILNIVRNTQINYYGFNSLYPTGPGLLGELYFGNIEENMNMIDNFDLVFNMINGEDVIIYKNQIILQSYTGYRSEQRRTQQNKHYTQLWNQRSIYTF
uniref:Glycosyltransferase n=1 Tax=viral metagenome TaxID=1070528 RepID=A0A6C0JW69_9ZZZZ